LWYIGLQIQWYFRRRFSLPVAKDVLVKLLEAVVRRPVFSPGGADLSHVRSILVIRQHDMLGDFLLSTPVLRALRSRFPDARIGVLVRDHFVDAVLHNPHMDELLVTYKGRRQWNPRFLLSLMKKLYRKWDIAIVLNTVSHSMTSDFLAVLAARRYVLGSVHRPFAGSSRNFFYNLLSPYAPHPRHQSERNLDIVRYIGADTTDLSEEMYLEDSEIAAARKRLEQLGAQWDRPVIAMHVGAGKVKNRWPATRFAGLAQLLHDRHGAHTVLCWGPGESALADEFRRCITLSAIEIPPDGLRELAAVFTQCSLVVCNDTGVMHLAAAVGTPLVAIFGPTNAAEWKPVGDSFVAVQSTDGTMEGVSVDEVYRVAWVTVGQVRAKETAQ
jgi:ADP-heptose:LPS heptosyltransferase